MQLQMNQPPINTSKFWAIIIGVLGTALIIAFNIGCNPARKVEKAEQLVRTTTPSFNKIGYEWNALHPCENDTFYKSKPDTITKPGDTIWHYNWVTDTVHHHDTLTITKTVYKNIVIKDTGFINDKQLLKIDVDSIAKLNREKSAANQNIVDLNGVINGKDKERNKWLWFFIGACVILAGTNAFWIYSKFKIPI
jgi:hypothetical protein